MELTKRLAGETAKDYAYRQICNNIISMGLIPGSTVSENELANELGISRTPVREVLQQLNKSHLVEIYPQKGCVIALLDLEMVEEAVFLRKVLEKAIVEELCDHITEDQMEQLKQNIQIMEFYVDHSMLDKIYEQDNEFHHLLFQFCNKEQTYQLVSSMQIHFNRIRNLSLYSVKEIKIVSDHKAILNAISLRDKQLSAEFIIKHLSRYKLDEQEIYQKYPEYFRVTGKLEVNG